MNEQTLPNLLDMVWSHLVRGVADRHHPARHPTLATIGPDGPEARTIVLRAANRGGRTLEFHTDAASPKVAHLRADPRIAVHVWLPKPRLQIRARGMATLAPGDPTRFAALPPEAQANYGGPAPGTPLGSTDAGPGADQARFSRVICTVTEIDALVLSDPHRRAQFTVDQDWSGQWVAP